MLSATVIPGLRLSTTILAALSLSIGWGIRGNFGHEYGAMAAGCMAAMAVCLLSGREDWRRRFPFFAFFGAIGWGFGASISYMQVIGYTHSGHAPTQVFGFASLFLIGFLWAALGGAGTAFPSVADRERMTQLFRPIAWVFVVWTISHAAVWLLETFFPESMGLGDSRHASPLYWLDADWFVATTAVLALFLFDLWDRRKDYGFRSELATLAYFAVGGALFGLLIQQLLDSIGWSRPLVDFLVRPQGDTEIFSAERIANTNWLGFFVAKPQYVGWTVGLAIGLAAYFALYGKFRSGSSMLMHMAAGWLVVFLIGPVFLTCFLMKYGGFRMTPPRSDDWAGIVGVFLGLTIYLMRNRLAPVAYASIVSGCIGGLGFSGVQLCKLLLIRPGNPEVVSDPNIVQTWAHWQSANWHSWLEQTYGFVNGIAIAVALGLLAARTPRLEEDREQRRWTEVFSVAFVLFLLTFLNIFKNVAEWTKAVMPSEMTAPLIREVRLPAGVWFTIPYVFLAVTAIVLMRIHMRRPLAAVPPTWLGKGQLMYLVFVWIMIVANFERALPGFTDGRILTEWVIIMNGIVVTALVLVLPHEHEHIVLEPAPSFRSFVGRAAVATFFVWIAASGVELGITRLAYGDKPAGHAGKNLRFGPEANWIEQPNLKGEPDR